MILDRLENAERYENIHPGFKAAFEFLRTADLGNLPEGRNDIDGNRMYAVVVQDLGKGRDGSHLETHRKYVDIQFDLSGCDCIGWKHIPVAERKAYDEKKDVELHDDPPELWLETPPGTFVIFFPEDAHAPMEGEGMLHKVIVKVAVDKR